MDANPDSPSHSSSTPAIAAILVVAALIAGVIVLIFQPPHEAYVCEKWNWDVRAAAQGFIGTRDALSAPRYDTVAFRAEVQEARLELRDVLADKPGEDCEIEEETRDLLEESEVQWVARAIRSAKRGPLHVSS